MTRSFKTSFQEFLKRQNTLGEIFPTSEYVVALNYFWNGDFEKSLDYLTATLAENPEHDFMLPFYRLWIANLAELDRPTALEELGEHLFQRGMETPELKQSFMALRGIIHNEIQETDAVSLILHALQACTHNPYVLEFMHQAESFETTRMIHFMDSGIPVVDYFHLHSFAKAFYAFGESEALTQFLRSVETLYRVTPMTDLFTMHQCFDSKYYPGAMQACKNLTENFPKNRDYPFYLGFAMLQCRNYAGVVQLLEGGTQYQGADPDYLNVLGRAYAALSKESDDDGLAKRASAYLEKAAVLARPYMLPEQPTQQLLKDLRDRFLSEDESVEALLENGGMRHWVVKLDSSLYHEIAVGPISTIQNIARPMGTGPRTGDLCFFVADAHYKNTDSDLNNGRWVVVALYEVNTAPSYDPIYGTVTGLQLIERLPQRVNVDVQFVDEANAEEMKKLPRQHPGRYGVFEMDDAGLAIISEAVRRRNLGVDHHSERRGVHDSQKKLS